MPTQNCALLCEHLQNYHPHLPLMRPPHPLVHHSHHQVLVLTMVRQLNKWIDVYV